MDALIDQLNNIRTDLGVIKTRTSQQLNSEIKKFKGREDERDFEQFLREYCRLGDALDWDEPKLLKNISQVLTGEALAAYDLLSAAEKANWNAIKVSLKAKFKDPDSECLARQQLQIRQQKPGESIPEFARAIENLVSKGFPVDEGYTAAQRSSIGVDSFLRGIKTEIKKVLLRQTKPADLPSAIAAAQKEEMVELSLKSEMDDAEVKKSLVELKNELKQIKEEVKEKVNVVNFDNRGQNRFRNERSRGYDNRGKSKDHWSGQKHWGKPTRNNNGGQRPQNFWKNNWGPKPQNFWSHGMQNVHHYPQAYGNIPPYPTFFANGYPHYPPPLATCNPSFQPNVNGPSSVENAHYNGPSAQAHDSRDNNANNWNNNSRRSGHKVSAVTDQISFPFLLTVVALICMSLVSPASAFSWPWEWFDGAADAVKQTEKSGKCD